MKIKITIAILIIIFSSCEKGGNEEDTILKFFTEAYEDTGNSIAIGEDGYYICGQMTDSLTGINPLKKPGIIKTGFDGNLIGEMKTFGDSEGSASKIIVLEDGTIVCTGYVTDAGSQKDIIVMHLNSDLSEITPSRIYPDSLLNPGNSGNQYGLDIIETQAGFLVLATTDVKRETADEYSGNSAGKKDILLLHLDRDLSLLAPIPAVGFVGNDEGVAVKEDSDGGYIVVGTTDRSDSPPSVQSGNNIILVRLNSDGRTTEPIILGGTRNETASDFEVLSDGYLITGTIGNAGIDQQGYVWKIPHDLYADPEYAHSIDIEPITSTKTPYSIKAMCRYKSSSFLLAGQYGTGLSARLMVISIDGSGTLVEGRKMISGGMGTQIANDIVTDPTGNIITIGSNSYENNSMICLLKFNF